MYTESQIAPEEGLGYRPLDFRRKPGAAEHLRARTGDFMLMMDEALNTDVALPVRGGSALDQFQELEHELRDKLDDISPNLTRDKLYATNYQSPEPFRLQLDESAQSAFSSVLRGHNQRLFQLAAKLSQTHRASAIFADSPYEGMRDSKRTCALAAFLMPFQAITGSDLATEELEAAIVDKYDTSIISMPHTVLPKIYSTSAFESQNPDVTCQPIMFAGCTIEDLSKLVEMIRHKFPNAQVRAVLSVLNKDSADFSVVHNVVPLGITPETSLIHDPASYGGPAKEVGTVQLLRRWYQAHGAGYLVVSQSK